MASVRLPRATTNCTFTIPGMWKLSVTSLYPALTEQKDHGVSPPKVGWPVKVLPEITDQLSMQVTMMQAVGKGEATTAKFEQVVTAKCSGTKHENTFSSKYTVKKARRLRPGNIWSCAGHQQ